MIFQKCHVRSLPWKAVILKGLVLSFQSQKLYKNIIFSIKEPGSPVFCDKTFAVHFLGLEFKVEVVT